MNHQEPIGIKESLSMNMYSTYFKIERESTYMKYLAKMNEATMRTRLQKSSTQRQIIHSYTYRQSKST